MRPTLVITRIRSHASFHCLQALRDASASLMHTLRRYASRMALSMSTAGGQALGQGAQRRDSNTLKSGDVKVRGE